jgi:hypothetical protein
LHQFRRRSWVPTTLSALPSGEFAGIKGSRRRGWTARPRPATVQTRPHVPARRSAWPGHARRPTRTARPVPGPAEFPAAAAPVRNASAAKSSAQNSFSAGVFGRTARRGAGRGPP